VSVTSLTYVGATCHTRCDILLQHVAHGNMLLQHWGGNCPHALERQTIIVSICNVACSVRSNPEVVCNLLYGILLAAIGAVSDVFAYYPHPGGQA